MSEDYDYLFKSVVVGDGGVGKTALTIRFSKGYFTEDYKMTIGVDFHVKTIKIETLDGPTKIKLQIWDTGGQERFASIRPMYYRGSLGSLIIFDLTSYESFEHLPQWVEEIRANIKNEIPLLLVGNKSDLIEQRVVTVEEINDFTSKFNLYYMETSAKTGNGVGDCFYILACLMIGSGVPDHLLSSGSIYKPGQVSIKPSSTIVDPSFDLKIPPIPEPGSTSIYEPEPQFVPEPEINYEIPPVPELPTTKIIGSEPQFVPEPEINYEIPPVPELPTTKIIEPEQQYVPEPEINYEIPPVPELPTTKIIEPEPEMAFEVPPVPEPPSMRIIEPESRFELEPGVDLEAPPVPERPLRANSSTEPSFESKFLSSSTEQETFSTLPEKPLYSESEPYKPKTVPFSSNYPVPVSSPEQFQNSDEIAKPLTFPNNSPSPETRPSSIPFESPAISSLSQQKEGISNVRSFSPSTSSNSDEIIDYTINASSSKKEKKKKPKKKKEKKEKKEKVKKEKVKKVKKVKVKEASPTPTVTPATTTSPPSLFQTLSKKTEVDTPEKSSTFKPFMSEKGVAQGASNLEIMPNEVIETVSSSFMAESQPPPAVYQEETDSPEYLLTCPHCGSQLSNDYLFCNRCGNKIQ